MLPKLILSDIDGVWTDGGMYYSSKLEELKKFNTYDSAGILLCHALNIPVGIITGEDSIIVENRARKLNIDFCFIGIKDKLKVANEIAIKLKITLKECAYIGDDLNDIELLCSVGFAGVVNSAPSYMKEFAHYVTKKNGGEGAFREFVEYILRINNCFDLAFKNLNIPIYGKNE